MEFGVPVWNGGLTEEDSNKIERVQKVVFKFLLGHKYSAYQSACEHFKVQSLKMRREAICLKFAKTEYKKEKSLFHKFNVNKNTRYSKKALVEEYNCNTDRFFKSSLPYLARLLNSSNK